MRKYKLRELKCLLTEAINLHKFSRLVQRRLSRERGKYPVRLLAESLFPSSLQVNALIGPSKTTTTNSFPSIPHKSF